jgi:hypothetical protein
VIAPGSAPALTPGPAHVHATRDAELPVAEMGAELNRRRGLFYRAIRQVISTVIPGEPAMVIQLVPDPELFRPAERQEPTRFCRSWRDYRCSRPWSPCHSYPRGYGGPASTTRR